MNNYCVDLNLNLSPLLPEIDINSFSTEPWQLLGLDLINPEVKNLFKSLNLNLRMAGMFVLTENSSGLIHTDGPPGRDISKLNWVVGSDNHTMNWYQIKDTTVQKIIETKVSDTGNLPPRDYTPYRPDEVELIHSQSVGYPSLIQAGIPHNVNNFKGTRRCITLALFTRSGGKLTMSQACERFSQYIKN